MADVFLSYAREDRAQVERIAQALEAAGFEVFWDVEIPPGTSWADFLEEKLANSRVALVLWSAHSTISQWVREEARLARDRGKLIPVILDGSAPPFGFGEIQAANLATWNGEADHPQWRLLLAGLERLVGRAATPPPSPPPPPRPSPPKPQPQPQGFHSGGGAPPAGGWNPKGAEGDRSGGSTPAPTPAPDKKGSSWLVRGLAVLGAVLGGLIVIGLLFPQKPTPAPNIDTANFGGPPPVNADIGQQARQAAVEAQAAAAAGRAAAEEARRNAVSGQQAATAAQSGDPRFGASQGPMGAIAGDLMTLQAGGPAAVGLVTSQAQFFGLMQVNNQTGGYVINGGAAINGGVTAAGKWSYAGVRYEFVGQGYFPNKFSLESREQGQTDNSLGLGVGIVRYANGERYEGHYRAVGEGAQVQLFRHGPGVHYDARGQVIGAGRFENDALVGQ